MKLCPSQFAIVAITTWLGSVQADCRAAEEPRKSIEVHSETVDGKTTTTIMISGIAPADVTPDRLKSVKDLFQVKREVKRPAAKSKPVKASPPEHREFDLELKIRFRKATSGPVKSPPETSSDPDPVQPSTEVVPNEPVISAEPSSEAKPEKPDAPKS
jgi:hypothetical protein